MTSRFPAGTVVMGMSPVVEAPSANPPTTCTSKGCLAGLSTSRTGTGLAGVLTTFTFEDGGTACAMGKSAKQESKIGVSNKNNFVFISVISFF
jgi:hypothetical protein